MALDPTIQAEFDKAHARAINASQSFWDQHAMIIGAAAQNDSRLMLAYVAGQLTSGFEETLVQSKSAYDTPHPPAAAPPPSVPATPK